MNEEDYCYCHYHDDTYEYFDCLDYMECEECPYYYADEDQVRSVIDMTIDEAIAREKELTEIYRNDIVPKEDYHNMPWIDMENELNMRRAEEHEQLAEWLEELKALRLLLDWAIECDFGLDSFPEEYEKYKHTLTDDMTYKDMIIQIAKCVVAEEIKE